MATQNTSSNNSKKANHLVVKKDTKGSNNKKHTSSKSKSLVTQKTTKKINDQVSMEVITKYKDVPLNELYNDLEGMKEYRKILTTRRDELIRAKSIIDSNKRKIAIAKTMENTFDIQFKLQDATFKNHYVPSGFKVVQHEEMPQQQVHDRVMGRSTERQLTDSTPVVIHRKEPTQVIHNNYHTTIINNQPQQQLPPQPVQQKQVGFVPQTITLYPQQQPAVTEIEITKPNYSIVWPLYERIKQIIKPRKYSSFIFPLIVIASILVALSLAFIIIWGFAVGWKNWDDNVIDAIRDFFINGFSGI